ncbi:flagellar assembly protein FliH [Azospirillum agricola]|uniref:flagellar assembly protein FliH n=1 Tax=Azospirillum agricola TaxID=1720247 RepID=UPI001AEA85C2|nr:flagellar assembly protein FliH [Azospirillum agricola]MBP2232404.1 flagellar assembly protein FliH [Azospirillum agricola]
MSAYPRYRFDHSFGTRVAAVNPPPVVQEPPPDPLDVPRHSERALQAALAEARNAGRAEGLLQGRQEGEASAARRIEAETTALLDALAGRLDGLAGAHDLLLERLEAQGAVVLVALVRRLTPHLLDSVARAEVERLAGDALRAAGGAPVLRLSVHPDLGAALEERLARQTVFKGRLEIVPDPALARGALDASWEAGGLRRDPEALEAALSDLVDRTLSVLTPP